MSYWQRFNPVGAFGDLVGYWRQPTPYRWQILALSVAITFTGMVILIPESERQPPRRPTVTYISTFEEGRTDAEIEASNIANQKRQDELQAQRDAAEARRKERVRALARATGIDVEAMERQIAADKAAEEAAAARAEQARSPSTNQAAGDR
jgi:hypothetical protein